MLDHKLADSDGTYLAVSKERLQSTVRLKGPLEGRRKRLVQDQEIDLIDTEFPSTLLEAVQRLVVSVVADPNLGLQEDLGSIQPEWCTASPTCRSLP